MALFSKCVYCGKEFVRTQKGQVACSYECRVEWYKRLNRKSYTKKQRDEEKYNTGTLCWKCKKATGFCSWSDNFTPVDGWTAIPTLIKNAHSNYMKSYKVIECPEFERD